MNRCVLRISLSLVCLPALAASDPSRIEGLRLKPKEFGQVAVSNPSLMVSKTARVDGQDVCGVIRITNTGFGPVTVSGIADSLEVHFPNNVPPPELTAGSTPNWFKVADVPIAVPGPIAPRTTATIPYCFSICQAGDYPGANSMRNVVTVNVANPPGLPRSFGARSNSFAPPFLDCQACCLPDGSCSDTVPERCTATGGSTQGTATECATTECPEACCRPDDTCTYEGSSACQSAAGEPQGPGTDCETTECCEPLGDICFTPSDCCGDTARCVDDTCCLELAETGCTERSHCCEESGTVALCENGKCCAPNRAEDSCHDTEDCCDENAVCQSGTCCIELGATGCTNLVGNDCCRSFGAVICEEGKCCAPTGAEDSCFVDSDCCDSDATCNGGTCCVAFADAGCEDVSDCCDVDGSVVCDTGRCCAPNRATDSCHDAGECCDENAVCQSGTCCIELGATGCTNLVGNDCCRSFGAVICESGKCCAPTGAEDSCNVDADCCDPNATCNGGTCCVRLAESTCTDASDCCDDEFGSVVCDAGRCCAPSRASDSCHDASDCCDSNATCSSGTCCLALGTTGCTNLVGNDCCPSPFGAVICEEGKCCAPTGADDSCALDSDCCDPNATCRNSTCCIAASGTGCTVANDCCSTTCVGGTCCNPPRFSCGGDLDCCGNGVCQAGDCCIPQFRSGCGQDSDCCSGLVCSGGVCEGVFEP